MKIIKVSFSKWKKGKLPDEGNGRDFQPSATMENLIRWRNSFFSRVLNALGQWVAELHSNVTFVIQRVGQPLVTTENFCWRNFSFSKTGTLYTSGHRGQ